MEIEQILAIIYIIAVGVVWYFFRKAKCKQDSKELRVLWEIASILSAIMIPLAFTCLIIIGFVIIQMFLFVIQVSLGLTTF